MFKKIQNPKRKIKAKPAVKVDAPPPPEQTSEHDRDASSELDVPVDETSPDNFDPTAEKFAQTLEADDASSVGDDDDLPEELRMDSVHNYLRATHNNSATFVVLKQERDGSRINFRLRADISPDWLKKQHLLREEQQRRKQLELDSVPPLVIKPHKRIDYLKKHQLKNFGCQVKKPSDLPPPKATAAKSSASKSPAVKILTKASPKLLKAPKTPPPAQKIVAGRKGVVISTPTKKKAANVGGDIRPKTSRTGQAVPVKQSKSPRNSRPKTIAAPTVKTKMAANKSPARQNPHPTAQSPKKQPMASKTDVSRSKKSAAVSKQKPSAPQGPASKLKPSSGKPKKK